MLKTPYSLSDERRDGPSNCLICLAFGAVTVTRCMCSAITLGRVAWVCPGQIAPHLAHFAGPWCYALRNIRDDIEKEHAFLGLCALLRANPEVGTLTCMQSHLSSCLTLT